MGLWLAALWLSCAGVDDCPARWADADGDGFGDPRRVVACDAAGVVDASDCDDGDAAVFPGARDACDGVDDDCDGVVDEDATDVLWYADRDRDGVGAGAPWRGCGVPPALYTAREAGDCDDLDPASAPGLPERCDGADNNCDGAIDENPTDSSPRYEDRDGDGFGGNRLTDGCLTEPFVAVGGDCDDTRSDMSPGGVEVCDGRDNNCDGAVDLGATNAYAGWIDADLDGFGGERYDTCAIGAFQVVPGYGQVRIVAADGDCDDNDVGRNPWAAERCNGVDDDCDGRIDDADLSVDFDDLVRGWFDGDGDGYGDDARYTDACALPADYVLEAGDCDDDDPDVSPGADERCNGVDDTCDDRVDEGCE